MDSKQIKNITDYLADEGRGKDKFIAHTAKGEIIVPPPVAQAIMPQLQKAFADNNFNISQFTVGEQANRMNPRTGLMEFDYGDGMGGDGTGAGGGTGGIGGDTGNDGMSGMGDGAGNDSFGGFNSAAEYGSDSSNTLTRGGNSAEDSADTQRVELEDRSRNGAANQTGAVAALEDDRERRRAFSRLRLSRAAPQAGSLF
jgi:hypothetical protein